MHENLKLIPKIDYTLDEEESENLKVCFTPHLLESFFLKVFFTT
jgi:hypothetical protein